MEAAGTAGVLVIFGITGDLARKMTFRALYRLESRGLLDCRIVGVALDDWSLERLRKHARRAIQTSGETVDRRVFDRLAERLCYVGGDFTASTTLSKVKALIGDAQGPVFYLETPPSLFAPVIKGLGEEGMLPATARVVIEKPFGHDLRSARALAKQIHRFLRESQVYRIDHFLGKLGLEEILYLRFANVMLEPVWNRNHVASVQIMLAERFGVQDRGHFYDPVGALRDVVVNHLMQLLAAIAMEAPAGSDAATIKDARFAVFRAMPSADPSAYVRGQYRGYRKIDGVARDSSTETYSAMRLEVDNWRWAGVPFFLRTGKCLPVTQTEVRLMFRRAPRLGFLPEGHGAPAPSQLIVRIDPTTGIRIILDARRAGSSKPEEIELEMKFADEGGEGPTPYEVLLGAAIRGDSAQFTRQDSVEETWRILQPLLDHPPELHFYRQGSWGPKAADSLTAGYGGWCAPWSSRA